MESARRWSGYVCPDCRFVFRVPRDHDGKGIVCPSCRRILRIPTAADTPPPLLAPVRRTAEEQQVSDEEPRKVKKRRRGKKAGDPSSHSWEQQSKSSRAGRNENRQMLWMLIGGAGLFALIVAGVIMATKTGGTAVTRTDKPTVAPEPPPEEAPAVVARSEAAILAEAEPLTRKFLEATTVEELLPLVRNPEVAEARMREFYPDGKIVAPGMSMFNPGGDVSVRGKLVFTSVRTSDYEEKELALIETPQGLKIDWESWAGWSEISWEKFLTTKPVTGHVFRIALSPVEYYNFGFTDDSKWQSYRLTSPDREHSIYGYAEKGSVLAQQIRLDPEINSAAFMLSLKFPAGATSDSQVEIERFVADGWVEEETP